MATVTLRVEGEVNNAVASLERVDNSLEKLGGGTQKAKIGLADLKAGFDIATTAVSTVMNAMEQAIGPVVEYGNQLRDLSAFAGISVEESSRLIQVTDDLGIEFNTLRTAARNMADNGLQPSLKTLAQLSDEYKAIQDPVERSQFLIDKFGARAGPQLAFALEQGSRALLQMGEDAEKTGLVVGDDFVERTEKARLAMDNWEDSVMGVKVALSETLLPAVGGLLDYMSGWLSMWGRVAGGIIDTGQAMFGLGEEVDKTKGVIEDLDPTVVNMHLAQERTKRLLEEEQDELQRNWGKWGEWADAIEQANEDYTLSVEEAKKAAQQAFTDLQTALDGPVKSAQDEYYQRQKDAGAAIVETQDRIKELTALPQLTDEQRTELDELQRRLEEQKQAYEDNATEHEKATARILFGFLQQRLAADGWQEGEIEFLAEVGKAWGLYDEQTSGALGNIDTALKNSQGNAETFLGLMDNVYRLPDKTITITTNFVTNGNPNPAAGEGTGPGWEPVTTVTPTDPGQTPTSGAY